VSEDDGMDEPDDSAGMGGDSVCVQAIKDVLPKLNPSSDVESLCEVCDQLNQQVDLLTKTVEPSTDVFIVQKLALHALCKLMGRTQPVLLVKLARIVLKLITTPLLDADAVGSIEVPGGQQTIKVGHALLTTSKLLWQLSKDEANDALFKKEQASVALLAVLEQALQCMRRTKKSKSKSKPSDKPKVSGLTFAFDVLIFVCGTLKNVSNSESNQRMLCQQGAVHCLSKVMRNGAPGGCWYQHESTKTAQMLVQVTAALRNLSVDKKHWKQFWDAEVVQGLCLLVMAYETHEELCLNISRILGKLTMNEKCRKIINDDKQNFPNLLNLLRPKARKRSLKKDKKDKEGEIGGQIFEMGQTNESETKGGEEGEEGGDGDGLVQPSNALVVRVCFVLGNMTSGNEKNRQLFEKNNGTEVGLQTLQRHASEYFRLRRKEEEQRELEEEQREGGESKDEADAQGMKAGKKAGGKGAMRQLVTRLKDVEDVLIKVIRMLANVAISTHSGPLIACAEGIDILTPVLQSAAASTVGAGGKGWRASSEELMLNCVSLITNMSFYGNPGTGGGDGSVWTMKLAVTDALLPILLHENEEAVIEAARAFGNLSRDAEVRKQMAASRVDEALCVLLDHGNREIVFTVCGVVMNIAADEGNREGIITPE
jgi:hypothetical protein